MGHASRRVLESNRETGPCFHFWIQSSWDSGVVIIREVQLGLHLCGLEHDNFLCVEGTCVLWLVLGRLRGWNCLWRQTPTILVNIKEISTEKVHSVIFQRLIAWHLWLAFHNNGERDISDTKASYLLSVFRSLTQGSGRRETSTCKRKRHLIFWHGQNIVFFP